MDYLQELLRMLVDASGSDLHLKPGQKPHARRQGGLAVLADEELSVELLTQILQEVLPEHLRQSFSETHEADFSLYYEGIGRFRVNAFHGKGEPCLVFRHVSAEIPTIEGLNLPSQLHRLSEFNRGIVLISGATGSGKSTTLAAIIGDINRNRNRRIITIEDPIEFSFDDDKSLITQREIGLDTLDYGQALRHVLRQDPDVILIGEMRDAETISTALFASETGHLVFSTLHASTAAQAPPRLLDVFPQSDQARIRLSLAANLQAVVCQRLMAATAGGMVPAVEIMFNTPTVRKLLVRDKLDTLAVAIETGGEDGMQSFDQSLLGLIKTGRVTESEAMSYASSPESLKMNLKGIFLDESRRIIGT